VKPACGYEKEIEMRTALKDQIQAVNIRYAAALAAGARMWRNSSRTMLIFCHQGSRT
jgi:hypothetical protein